MSTAIRESKEQETGAEGAGATEGAREVTHDLLLTLLPSDPREWRQ